MGETKCRGETHPSAKQIKQQARDGFTVLAVIVEPILPITCVPPRPRGPMALAPASAAAQPPFLRTAIGRRFVYHRKGARAS